MPEATLSTYSPLLAYKYRVGCAAWGSELGFSKASGLGAEIGIKEWREITDPSGPIRLPMEINFAPIVLERGLDPNRGLWDWWNSVAAASVGGVGFPRYSMFIQAFSKGSVQTREWEIRDAWPHAVRWGDLDAGSSGILVESLVIVHEGLKVK